ncbi:MAG: TetR/AcrR family transcriptional regulator, partial [Pseudomonadota bacterium]|nr:TetR/AcrR family transcriptional regulator [Pseudomonadota bacterium]
CFCLYLRSSAFSRFKSLAIDRPVNYTLRMSTTNDTRERIIEAAKSRFHNRSYADVGIKEICDMASIQKGSFYHFFPSKRDLVLAVIDEFAEDWANGFVAEAFDPALPPMERIDYVIDAAFFWQKSSKELNGHIPGCLFGNLALEISTQDDVLRAKLNAVFTSAKDRFKETLDEAIELGAISPLDSELTAEAMLAYLEGMILFAKAENDPEVIYRLGPALKTIRIESSAH